MRTTFDLKFSLFLIIVVLVFLFVLFLSFCFLLIVKHKLDNAEASMFLP